MPKKLLIVDDNAINRTILRQMLCDEYASDEAQSGEAALALLAQDPYQYSAVLLDIRMPGMDGYEVLRRIRADAQMYALPVIMITGSEGDESRVESLSMGANDYATKPYSAEIIKHCLRNHIALHEAAQTVAALQKDRLTGLYNRDTFLEKVHDMVRRQASGFYIMASFDIYQFKVINDQYGTEKGDIVLQYVADVFKAGFEAIGGICSRFSADNYAVLYPASFQNAPELAQMRKKVSHIEGIVFPITFSIGRYLITDRQMLPSAMYDRALLAADTVKGRFDTSIAVFDETMRESLLQEQEIVSEMEWALCERQFEVWLQPQYNHATGALIGSEALVRWRHPNKGIIPPNAFIPIFERNGFVFELDKFVWEEACRLLRGWLDTGRNPLPISVNVSRYDLHCPDLVQTITGIVRRYRVSLEFLRLEITESAFAQDFDAIVTVVKELVKLGYTVEIDDFGSGYSSLNTLKDVPAQVLKLDMRFLESGSGSARGGNILESIVRMGKWLGMSVIAEGVETKEQADYLQSVGCSYVQGYLYARPMPVADYERLANCMGKEAELMAMKTVDNLDNNAFWDPASMDTLIFNSYVGSACIFEYYMDKIELIRVSPRYANLIRAVGLDVEQAMKLKWAEHLEGDGLRQIRKALKKSMLTHDSVATEQILTGIGHPDGRLYIRFNLRVIAVADVRYLVYCTYENLTAQREAEQERARTADRLQAVMDNVGSGITALTAKGGKVHHLFANDRYIAQFGYTRAAYAACPDRLLVAAILPEDRQTVLKRCEAVGTTGKPDSIEYRIKRADGRLRLLRSSITSIDYPGEREPVVLSATMDITETAETQRELLDNLPGGAGIYEYRDGRLSLTYRNKSYWELLGLQEESLPDAAPMSAVHPNDTAVIMQEIRQAIAGGSDVRCDIRLLHASKRYIHVHLTGRIVRRETGRYLIFVTFTPIKEEIAIQRQMLPRLLSATMEASNDYAFAKSKSLRYICCSPAFLRLAGRSSQSEIIGKTDYELFPADLADEFRRNDLVLFEGGKPLVDFNETIRALDGTEHFCRASKYILRGASGDIIGLYGVSRDITLERSALEQLRFINAFIPGGLATYELTDDSIRLKFCNDGFCELLEIERDRIEACDFDPMTWVLPEDRPVLAQQNRSLLTDEKSIDCRFRIRTPSGRKKLIHYMASVSERRKNYAVINTILLDITKQHSALAQLPPNSSPKENS